MQAAGEEPFLTGLQAYLRKYSYSNVTSDRLWAELGAATSEDVPSWMQAWTFQPGAPRIEVLLDGPLKRDVKVYQVMSSLFVGISADCGNQTQDGISTNQ